MKGPHNNFFGGKRNKKTKWPQGEKKECVCVVFLGGHWEWMNIKSFKGLNE